MHFNNSRTERSLTLNIFNKLVSRKGYNFIKYSMYSQISKSKLFLYSADSMLLSFLSST